VAFNTTNGLNAGHLSILTLAGITRGYLLQNLGMVAAPATAAQVRTLAANPAVRSIWANDRRYYLNDQTRVLTGVDRVRIDAGFTSLHQGLPVRARGLRRSRQRLPGFERHPSSTSSSDISCRTSGADRTRQP